MPQINLTEEEYQALLLERNKAKRERVEEARLNIPIRPLEEIPDQEKVAAFDKLYGYAKRHYEELSAKGWADDDFGEYMRQEVISLLARPESLKDRSFWGWWRKLYY